VADPHDELTRLLDHARADAPSEQLISQVRERVLTSAASGPGGSESAAPQAAGAAHGTQGLLASWSAKLVICVAGLGLMTTAYLAQRSAAPEPERAPQVEAPLAPAPLAAPASVEVIAPPALPPAIAALPAEPAATPLKLKQRPAAPRAAAVPVPAPVPVPALPPPASFAEEVALIKAALAAQREGRPDEAREKLAEHARRFPEGQLVSERKRIEARLVP
jgi:hypothetical protein